MSKWDKAMEKYRMEKLIEETMNTPKFKKMQQQQDEQNVANAIGYFAFITCEYLETRHGYKGAGLKRFLEYFQKELACTSDNKNFFKDCNNYFKEEYNVDVLKELGMEIESEVE